MKKQLVSILLILMGWAAFAQKGAPPETYQLSFADSIRVLLNNTKSQEAMALGDAFGTLWTNLDKVWEKKLFQI
ncbi:MAG: hypothetical protein ACKOEV_11805 [Cytophagales bacterium]